MRRSVTLAFAAAILGLCLAPTALLHSPSSFSLHPTEWSRVTTEENTRIAMKQNSSSLENISNIRCKYPNCSLNNGANGRRRKNILVWPEGSVNFDKFFGWATEREDALARQGCQPADCAFTRSRSLMAPEDFDAILVEAFYFGWVDVGPLPRTRSPRQRYIFYSMESPERSPPNLPLAAGMFNWTMTYRADSDIPQPYGRLLPHPGVQVPARGWPSPPAFALSPEAASAATLSPLVQRWSRWSRRSAAGKGPARVAWLVSNCHTPGRRERFVDLLARHVRVHVFGKCSRDERRSRVGDTHTFHATLDRKFHFYLAFENSLCQEYITEKLFNTLQLKVIPVVYGGANYSAVLPPYSYIDARAFASPRHLAEYLHYLAGHMDEYEKYFWWKKYYSVDTNATPSLCRLCAMLHDDSPPKSYSNIRQWWKEDMCFQPDI